MTQERLVQSVFNQHDGKRYTVSTVKQPNRELWETVVFKGRGFFLRRTVGAISTSSDEAKKTHAEVLNVIERESPDQWEQVYPFVRIAY